MTTLTIGKVAKAAGLGVETVRFYERQGLIAEPARSESGYRQYRPETIRRLQFIVRAKALGFTLQEIGDLLDLRATPGAGCADVQARAEEIFAAFGNTLSLRGSSAPLMVAALDQYHDQALEVVIVEHPTRDAEALVEVLRSTYLPQIVTAIGTTDELGDQTELIPFVEHKVAQSGHPTAYVCRRSNCELPTSDPQIFQSQLARIEPYTAPVEPIQVVDPAALPDPWEYDSQRNRHWHPGHGHWHDGPPPQGGR